MLYLVGVPVGNWQDMPLRNIDIIKNAKHLIVENEEEFQAIKNILNINPNTNIIHIGSIGESNQSKETNAVQKVLDLLKLGEDVCMISDEGMPGIADPGEIITKETIKHGYHISATPGPSSIIAAASLAGCQQSFKFISFFSENKSLRQKAILGLINERDPMIVMLRNTLKNDFVSEIEDILKEMIEIWGEDRNGLLCYNLTTRAEKTIRGRLSMLRGYHANNRNTSDKVILVIDGNNPMLSMPEAL